MYDLIGDIHGYATPLKKLLEKLGYQHNGQYWSHSTRKVIFLGDFVDRGPEQIDSVLIAKAMVENNTALAVMGNHEFNAVAYATPDPKNEGEYLRPHSEKNQNQHAAFLDQVGEGSQLHHEFISWFKTLPVFLDLEGLRVIHACWDEKSLKNIKPLLKSDNTLKNLAWYDVTEKGTDAFEAAETLLKGLEIPLPADSEGFFDKDNNHRMNIRTRWWETDKFTYRDLAIVPDDVIEKVPHDPIADDLLPGYEGDKPLFLGHYWLTGTPKPRTDHIAILDYSIAAQHTSSGHKGKLCAYRWDGEHVLSEDNFVWVEG
ncbi:metallophosphoesterase [Methylophaga sp. OBS3]|uniref:metallophosphoesterase n=1 Tax=Methylophaga sp. OBS3 TaxID=2991934 RepID=UPI0022537EA1|nr:metallophosphoesterase [Methylophaga sp. OBS3]